MNAVVITGWRTGLKKIFLTKLIRLYTGYGLAKGKHCVDEVLEGKKVVLAELSGQQVREFMVQAHEVGAICEVVSDEVLAA